jgi:hypothetical protein
MSTTSSPEGMSERDRAYWTLLQTLRTAGGVAASDLGVVRRIAAFLDSAPVLELICETERWRDDWEVKEALLQNARAPARWREGLERSIAIFDLLRELDAPELTEGERQEIQEDVKHLFKLLPEHDRGVVKRRAYELSASRKAAAAAPRAATAAAPAAAADMGDSGALLASELDPTVSTAGLAIDASATGAMHAAEAAPAAEAPPEPSLLDSIPADLADTPVDGLEAEPVEAPAEVATAAPLPAMAREQAVLLARTTADANVLTRLAYETADDVVLALLDNPAMNDRLAALIARRANQRVAGEIYRRRALFMRPLVRAALLECPHAPSGALLEAVNSIGDLGELLKLLRSPRVKFLEVKSKARARLAMRFKALGMGEKLAAIRRSGGALLRELWTDFFRDEQLVLQCIQGGHADASIVLEIARSRIAPRRALEAIAASAAWTANYQICLELVLNPKTPRHVVARLIPKLSPADRRMVKSNASLPDSIRRMA